MLIQNLLKRELNNMKFTKVCVDRNQFAKRLGVEPSQIAVAEVEHNLDDVTITLVLDNDAELKSDIDACTIYDGGRNLRRFKLVEDTESLKKQVRDYQTQNLKLHQEIAELQQDLIYTHLKNFDEKRQESAVNSFGESLINLIKNDDTSLDEKVDDLFDTYKDYIKFIKGILDNK